MPVSVAFVGQHGEWHVLEALATSEYAAKFKLPIRGVNMAEPDHKLMLDDKVQLLYAWDDESWVRALEGVDVVIDFRDLVNGANTTVVDAARLAGAKVYVTNSQKSMLPVLAFAGGF